MLHWLICKVSKVTLERNAIQSSVSSHPVMVDEFVLLRRPAVPRFWDSEAKPHVAAILDDPVTGKKMRYYLSSFPQGNVTGRIPLEVVDIDALGFAEGTGLEVRFDDMRSNLYKLELVENVPCWRWVGRSRGLQDVEYPPSIERAWGNLVYDATAGTDELIAK